MCLSWSHGSTHAPERLGVRVGMQGTRLYRLGGMDKETWNSIQQGQCVAGPRSVQKGPDTGEGLCPASPHPPQDKPVCCPEERLLGWAWAGYAGAWSFILL